jgi:hypothetical protein
VTTTAKQQAAETMQQQTTKTFHERRCHRPLPENTQRHTREACTREGVQTQSTSEGKTAPILSGIVYNTHAAS